MKQQDNTIKLTENTPLGEALDIILARLKTAAANNEHHYAVFTLRCFTAGVNGNDIDCEIFSLDGRLRIEKGSTFSDICPEKYTIYKTIANINDILNDRREKQDGKEGEQ